MSAHANPLVARAGSPKARRGELTPLSQSPLWRWQRRYFEKVGIRAWRDNVVPSFITSNAFIAQAYSRMAAAYLADLPPQEPLTILELGAGSGRFAHFLLRDLFGEGEVPRVRYVMTDISAANIAFWRGHAKFAPYIARGALDFARFDPLTDRSLKLELSGETLSSRTTLGSVMAIANYVFDGLEQDLFETVDGDLREVWASLGDFPEAGAHEGLDALDIAFHECPCDSARYPQAAWNDLLAAYRSEVRNGAFLFPVGAARAVDNLRDIANDRLFLLCADKGPSRIEAFRGARRPEPVKHGSVSLGVNFHALAALARAGGGEVFELPHVPGSLNVVGLAFGAPGGLAQTRRAYQDAIVANGPDDLFLLKKGMELAYAAMSLPQMTAFLRVMRWDPSVVVGLYGPLADALPKAPPLALAPVYDGLLAAWAQYLPLGEEEDFAFCLGNLMAAMGRYQEALEFFEASLAAYGEHEAVRINMGLCRRHSSRGS